MKLSLLFVVLMSVFLLLAGPAFPAIDGTKTLTGEKSGVTMQVPEKAPEFLGWNGFVIGEDRYPNGNALVLIECKNDAETVIVRSLWAKIDGKFYVLAFAVYYEVRPGEMDLYQDVGFIDTGTPTGRLLPVAESAPLSAFKDRMIGGGKI